jgi:hypothetical protein
MIEWFDKPYVGTDADGFEVLIHAVVYVAGNGLHVVTIDAEGQLGFVHYGRVKMDWRWTRDKGWFGTEEQMANT